MPYLLQQESDQHDIDDIPDAQVATPDVPGTVDSRLDVKTHV